MPIPSPYTYFYDTLWFISPDLPDFTHCSLTLLMYPLKSLLYNHKLSNMLNCFLEYSLHLGALTEIQGHTFSTACIGCLIIFSRSIYISWGWKVKSVSLWFLEMLLDWGYAPLLWGVHISCTTPFPLLVPTYYELFGTWFTVFFSASHLAIIWVASASMRITLLMPWTGKWPPSLVLTHPLTAAFQALPLPPTAQINGS